MKKILFTSILLLIFSSILFASDKIQILNKWKNAHTYENVSGLSSLYGETVTYYGKSLSKDKCISDKKRVLKKYPNFTMRIDNIQAQDITSSLYKLTFDKYVKTKSNGLEKKYPSYLVVSNSQIIEEGDGVTDNLTIKVKIDNDIKKNKSYQVAGVTYVEYIIKGKKEECRVTYDEYKSLTNTSCLSITNSKGVEILCTKNKNICKTTSELAIATGNVLDEVPMGHNYSKHPKSIKEKQEGDKNVLISTYCQRGIIGGSSIEYNNPYNLIGKCIDEMFQIEQYISKNRAYGLLYSQSSGRIRTNARVIITSNKPIRTMFKLTSGIYKIVDVEQSVLSNGASVAIPILKVLK